MPPSKIVSVGEEVDAIVSELDMSQRRISLSLRQVESNPWEDLAARFPVGTIVEGRVRNLTEFGAFVGDHGGDRRAGPRFGHELDEAG